MQFWLKFCFLKDKLNKNLIQNSEFNCFAVFFEIIQRKGATSFGKGNFKALFEAILSNLICMQVVRCMEHGGNLLPSEWFKRKRANG